MKQELGLSKFVLAFLGAYLIGNFLAQLIPGNLIVELVIFILLAGLLIFFWSKIFYRLVFIGLLGLILGIGYYHVWDFNESKKSLVYGQNLEIEGIVDSRPVVDGAKQQIILKHNNTKILIQVSRYPEFHYADPLKIKGKIKDPAKIETKDNFNYGQYLLHRGIRGLVQNPETVSSTNLKNMPPRRWHRLEYLQISIYKIIYAIGDKFEEIINKILPEPYAALQNGLILGTKSSIPDSLMSAFNRTGVTHIIAVSGYNVTIIISALTIFLMLFSRRTAFWGSILAILVFVILTGASASVVRAGVLASLVSWGKTIGRRPYYPVVILITAFVMLFFNPYALRYDLSFDLSFLAFAGIVSVAPKFSEIKLVNFLPPKVRTIFCETMSAQIMVLPILLYNFGILSIVAPLANILILPTIPAAMLLGFLGGIGGMIWIKIGHIIGLLAWIILKYIIVTVEFLSKLKFSAVNLSVSEWWWIPVYYCIILIWLQGGHKENKKL